MASSSSTPAQSPPATSGPLAYLFPEKSMRDADKEPLLPKTAPSVRCRKLREPSQVAQRRIAKTLGFGTFLVFLIICFGLLFWENEDEYETGLRAVGKHGAVASDVQICSKIGVGIMKKGGNAIDAAIATGACLGTVNMFASGVGGGGFMVVRKANGTSKSFNFREMAPGNASRDMYGHDAKRAQVGGLAIAIPGEVHGFAAAHRTFGHLPWHELWEPSIALNRHGFQVPTMLARIIKSETEFFNNHREDWQFLFSETTDELVIEGETITRPAYAHTLAGIAGNGSSTDPYAGVKAFYNGSLAEQLAGVAQAAGGILTAEDFSHYHTVVSDTVNTTFHDRTIITCPPPCSGVPMLEGLNILEGLPVSDPNKPETHHYIVEGMKWLSAGRTELGDPADPVVANNSERIAELMTKSWAGKVRANISADTTYDWKHYKPSYEPNDPKGTTHLSVIDRFGNAVGLTTTVNLYWGAKVHDTGSGIVLNSEMDDFSIPGRSNAFQLTPSIYNYIQPYKRPLSSIAPTIVVAGEDGFNEFVIGGSGGSRIVTSVFESVVKKVLWGYSLLDTIKSSRVHHQLMPELVYAEADVEDWVVDALEKRGHDVERKGRNEAAGGSVLQAVARRKDGQGVEGVADWWRKGGRAAGY